jgi:broad specificity phosphatase PhoE
MTTRVRLICHAPTAATRRVAFAPDDEPAEPKALQKLVVLPARALQNVLTSPALCARQTAEALHCVASIDPALRDCDYGRWTGRDLDFVLAEDPVALGTWLTDPASAPHGGESMVHVIARVAAWLDRLGPGAVTAITHAVVIRAAIVHALGAPASSCRQIDIAPLSATQLSAHEGRWTLRGIGPFEP